MKTLYLECNMGAAGDMLTAALLELHPDPEAFVRRLNALGLPGVSFRPEPMEKCGVRCTHMTVTVNGAEEESEDVCGHEADHCHAHPAGEHGHEHHHSHHSLHGIEHLVSHLDLPAAVKDDVTEVYRLIAEAEGRVHGKPAEEIHFHEVGTLDAVADVTAVCLLLHELAPERILASPVHVGCGEVRCAHGVLPVPAPAAAYLLRGIPTYGGEIRGELCTPTGAALLRHFAEGFGPQPLMRVEKLGYGCGKKDFERANCVRALLGEAADARDRAVELRCNLDDITAEEIGFALEELFAAGALDAFTTPIGMKKNRPGVLLTCLCREADKEAVLRALFVHTTTLGVREFPCERHVLERQVSTRDTPYGAVRVKRSAGYGVVREKLEYEDLARIARERGVSLSDAASLAEDALKG